jgi:hypothetical protein
LTTTPVRLQDENGGINNFRKVSKLGGRISLKLTNSFDSLPDKVRKAAEDAGGTKDNTYDVIHKHGSIWIIRDTHETAEGFERTFLHEVCGHLRIFRLFDLKNIQQFNKLFKRLGGLETL